MKIIEDARSVWRHFSTIGLLILAALPGAWEMLPPDTKAALPDAMRDWIHIIVALWALGGKFIVQKPPRRRKP